MTEVACLMVESTDVIIEGTLVDIVPQPIYSTPGLCTWVAELVFIPSQIIKGKVVGDSLHAWTLTMPDYFDISGHYCGQARSSDTVPLPPGGAEGMFCFHLERHWIGVMEEALVFESSPGSWLEPSMPARLMWAYRVYEFPYEDFVPALVAAANQERLKRLEPEATFIAVVVLGRYDEREQLRNENGTLTVRFPVAVREVLRGSSSPSAFIDLVEPPDIRENTNARMEVVRQQHLGKEFYRLQSRRVLVMGSCSDSVITIDPGVFEITDQDTVLFGVSGRTSLSELRTRLR